MPTQNAEAEWKGNLAQGSGRLKVGSGAFEGPYSFKSRFEEGQSATNPEELIGAAHAGCFTMALAFGLQAGGYTPTELTTEAAVTLEAEGQARRRDLALEVGPLALDLVGRHHQPLERERPELGEPQVDQHHPDQPAIEHQLPRREQRRTASRADPATARRGDSRMSSRRR